MSKSKPLTLAQTLKRESRKGKTLEDLMGVLDDACPREEAVRNAAQVTRLSELAKDLRPVARLADA